MSKSARSSYKFQRPDPAATADVPIATQVLAMVDEMHGRQFMLGKEPWTTDTGNALFARKSADRARLVHVMLELLRQANIEHQRAYDIFEDKADIQPDDALREERVLASHHVRILLQCIEQLARVNLDLPDETLALLINASHRPDEKRYWLVDVKHVLKQVQYALKRRRATSVLRSAAQPIIDGKIDFYRWGDTNRGALQGLVGAEADEAQHVDSVPVPPKSISAPTDMVGHRGVLAGLKRRLGFPYSEQEEVTTEIVGADQFPLRSDSPLAEEHRLLSSLVEARGLFDHWRHTNLRAKIEVERRRRAGDSGLATLEAASAHAEGQARRAQKEYAKHSNIVKALPPAKMGRMLLATIERYAQKHDVDEDTEIAIAQASEDGSADEHPAAVIQRTQATARELANEFVEQPDWTIDEIDVFDLLLGWPTLLHDDFKASLVEPLRRITAKRPLTTGEQYVLQRVAVLFLKYPPLSRPSLWNTEICKLMGTSVGYWLAPCEQWADTLHNDMAAMKPEAQQAWHTAIVHALSATLSSPSAKWRKAADDCIKAVGSAAFRKATARWFADVATGDSVLIRQAMVDVSWYDPDEDAPIHDGNAVALRGLVWMLARAADAGTPQVVGSLLLESARNTPGTGPRSGKLANACIWTLGELAGGKDAAIRASALAQLARAKTRVKNKPILASINKAHDKAAKAVGISREKLEESGMPAFGFENGMRVTKLGDATVELRIASNKVITQWTNAAGKVVKAPPAAVKRDHAGTMKELKQVAKDAEAMLAASRVRLDSMYLMDMSWQLKDWREHYLDHGLIGTLAGRLIWLIDKTPVMQFNGKLVDVKGKPVKPAAKATVRLWHPIDRGVEEVHAWRTFVEEHEITQPFKQAHREVYLLTDAELATATYSNRFAAHLIKQHQFGSLCAVRQWRHKLHMVYEGVYPPSSRDLPKWNLRAEFWVEGAGESDPMSDGVNDSGTFTHLATDQVRFYPVAAAQLTTDGARGGYALARSRDEAIPELEPLRLDQIPPLVFSEIMRDVDLFVGVASVGNDPTWLDGNADRHRNGRQIEYWHNYSFGDLSATAGTRKQVLQRLIPRLKIADRCSFTDRFLVVKGDIRTYKIHLGSGNILMEPNDQYLCIVPKAASVDAADGKMFLPFEGDRTMSIILSKALLLAEDTKIKDASIVSQIGRK